MYVCMCINVRTIIAHVCTCININVCVHDVIGDVEEREKERKKDT